MFECILFSHNEVETRNFFYEIFADLGYKIITTPTYKEVLEILKKERPDYIILGPTVSDIPIEVLLEKIKVINGNIKVIILDGSKNRQESVQDIIKTLKRNIQTLSSAQKETKRVQIKANILVVDDEAESAQLLKNYLSKRGYNVDIALSGEEAMTKINMAKSDIVLLDIYMQGIDGLVVLKAIKEIDKSIIVIITTGVEDTWIIKEAMNLGANGYLVKPFNLVKLEELMLAEILANNPS